LVEEVVYQKFLEWIKEDIPFWDITTEIIPENCYCKAVLLAKSSGVAACIEEVAYFLEKLGFKVEILKNSGEEFSEGEAILEIEGKLKKLLMVERVILNILMHTCGVATATRKVVEKVKRINPKVVIAATRKTLPGLRYFEKKAVKIGGGDTHRFSLSDMVLIKNNHLKYFNSIKEAIEAARKVTSFSKKIEVEVSSPSEAIEAAKSGADIVMLDNFTPNQVAATMKLLEREGLRDKVLVEVSGGITIENVEEYARLKPDIISMGWITHSVKAVDLSMKVLEVKVMHQSST